MLLRVKISYAVRSIASVRYQSAATNLGNQRSSLKEEILKFDKDIGVKAAYTPPGSWYTREDVYELERETVFSKNWIAVAGSNQLKEPGDYITGFLGDEPYLITKDKNCKTQYFYNFCRHHGALLCKDGKGNCSDFTCQYHGWKYSLEGRLTQARKLRSIENFKAKDYGLKKFSGTEWYGVLFLHQDPNADPMALHRKLGVLNQRLEMEGCFENNLTYIATKTFPVNCNWKVTLDNFLDGLYHVPHCHKALDNIVDETSYKTEAFEGFSIQSGKGVDEKSRVGSSVLYAHIYPNLFFNRYGHWVDVTYVLPTGVETCDVLMDFYYDTDAYKRMNQKERTETIMSGITDSSRVQDEDTEICESVQKGMRSKAFGAGRYAPLLENLMYDFHCQLAEDYLKEL